MINIRKARNGYIVCNGPEEIFTSLEDLFNYLLIIYEGRSKSSINSSYGNVVIDREYQKPSDKLKDLVEFEEEVGGIVYGHYHTIHQSKHINVETYKGKVVSLWFRCLSLPFIQTEVNALRATDMVNNPCNIQVQAIEYKKP